MRIVDIITKKEAGMELNRDELTAMVMGYVAGTVPDYQVSAF